MIEAPSKSRGALWLFCAALALNAWGISIGWNNAFLPGNEFRQTQTAITALFIQREANFSLAYPTPVLGKPWSVPNEFPLYQWSVVGVARVTGLTLTQSARTVSCACFYLALGAVWLLLARIGATGPRRLVVLTMVLSCPLYVFYARAFLIETMALMFSLWFLVGLVNALERRSVGWLAVANLAGAGAGLVKVTTFIIYLIPAGVFCACWLWRIAAAPRSRADAEAPDSAGAFARALGWIFMGTALPFALTLWWVRLADSIKALNASGQQFVSAAVNSYFFGDWEMRRSPELWRTFAHTLLTQLTAPVTLVLFLVITAVWGGRWRKWIFASAGVFAAGPLVFPLLYSWHEYYFTANGVCLMIAVGLALGALLDSRLPRWTVWLAVIAVQVSQVVTYFHVLYPHQSLKADGGSGLTRLIRDVTGPDDVLIIAGDDWAPMIPYYSQRRALMVRRNMDHVSLYLTAAFDALKGEHAPILLVRGEVRANSAFKETARKYFGYEATPIATWEDVEVFVQPGLRDRFSRQTHATPYGGVKLDEKAASAADTLESVETVTSALPPERRSMFENFAPAPVRFSSRFAIGLMEYDGRRILMAHPTSRLVFAPEPGTRQITAGYGILPGAYENVPAPENPTKGVEFAITCVRRDGSSKVVFRRWLDPAMRAADRGLQTLNLTVLVDPHDELVASTAPGPSGSINRGWAYWTGIEIR
ncbi:MAG: hypothetical protein JWM88_3062 [Verrucomicrobia bacterium]|nr:hypothetical protein [Verrucomicrobiota bacterium]